MSAEMFYKEALIKNITPRNLIKSREMSAEMFYIEALIKNITPRNLIKSGQPFLFRLL